MIIILSSERNGQFQQKIFAWPKVLLCLRVALGNSIVHQIRFQYISLKRSNIFSAQIGDPIFGRRGYNRNSKGGGDKLEGGLGVQPDGGLGVQPDGGIDHQVVR